MEEVDKSTQKVGKSFEEDDTPQLALEDTQSEQPIENDKVHADVKYDTLLENTLSIMQKNKDFFQKRRKK